MNISQEFSICQHVSGKIPEVCPYCGCEDITSDAVVTISHGEVYTLTLQPDLVLCCNDCGEEIELEDSAAMNGQVEIIKTFKYEGHTYGVCIDQVTTEYGIYINPHGDDIEEITPTLIGLPAFKGLQAASPAID